MCDIRSIQLGGVNFSAQGVPTSLELVVRLDCTPVDIEIRRSATDATPFLSASGVASTPQSEPAPGEPPRTLLHTFALRPGDSVRCDDTLHVTVSCSDDRSCRSSQDVQVLCKGFEPKQCPDTVVLGVAPPINQTGDCLPAGTYTVTVEDPLGSDVSYFWSSGRVGAPQSDLPSTGPSQTVQVHGGDPPTIVSVIALKQGCPPKTGNVLLPAGRDANCPTGYTVEVAQGSNVVAGPHTNLDGVAWEVAAVAPGTYTLRVTQPSGGGESYDWFGNSGTLDATGPQNSRDVTVAAGLSVTTSFTIRPSDCCPPMSGSVKLTGQGGAPPPGGTPPPGETPPGGTPPSGNPPETTPPPVVVPPPFFCVVIDFVVAIALVVALLAVVAGACAPLAPLAVPVLITAAAVALVGAVLLLIVCGPSRCHILSILVWALKWAIVLGFLMAVACGALLPFVVVLLYGVINAALIWAMISTGCARPRMLGMP